VRGLVHPLWVQHLVAPLLFSCVVKRVRGVVSQYILVLFSWSKVNACYSKVVCKHSIKYSVMVILLQHFVSLQKPFPLQHLEPSCGILLRGD
jgi:hypothetical protein